MTKMNGLLSTYQQQLMMTALTLHKPPTYCVTDRDPISRDS